MSIVFIIGIFQLFIIRLWWLSLARLSRYIVLVYFFQFKIIINVLVTVALSASFEYLCYGSTASVQIISILLFHCGDRL